MKTLFFELARTVPLAFLTKHGTNELNQDAASQENGRSTEWLKKMMPTATHLNQSVFFFLKEPCII